MINLLDRYHGEFANLNFPENNDYSDVDDFITGRLNKQTSKYRGVRFDGKKYQARIGIGQEEIYLGRFTDEIDAALMHDQAARMLEQYKVNNLILNFPDIINYDRINSPQRLSQLTKVKSRFNTL